MKRILLKGQDICKIYGKKSERTKVLDSVSIEIYESDFTIIMGASGAGKSTLLYALSGMNRINSGKVEYKKQGISRFSEKQMSALRSKEFGFIFQQAYLVSNLTLFENVAIAGYASKTKSAKEVQRRAEQLLSQMNVENAWDRLPSQASGGEVQRAAVARAMINNPGLIFADEPTGSLNKSNSEEVLNLLSELNEQGQSVLMVTHDPKAAIRGTRILYLEDGKFLDELVLSKYQESDIRDREGKLSKWLTSLQW